MNTAVPPTVIGCKTEFHPFTNLLLCYLNTRLIYTEYTDSMHIIYHYNVCVNSVHVSQP